MFIEGLYHYSQSFDRLYEEDATNPAYLQERETIFTYISISLVLLILSVDKTIKLIYLLTKQYIAENNICEEVLYNPSEDQEQFSEEQSKASLLSSLDTIIKRRRSSMEQYTSSQSMEAYNPLDQLLSSRDGRGRDRGRGRGAREDESANGFDLEMDIDMNIEDHVYTVSNYMSTYFFSVSTIIDLVYSPSCSSFLVVQQWSHPLQLPNLLDLPLHHVCAKWQSLASFCSNQHLPDPLSEERRPKVPFGNRVWT